MPTVEPGFLAIWSDVTPEEETDYVHWLSREHVLERVGVEGFAASRVFRALDAGVLRYFFLYELSDPTALSGPSYMARLNDPTPWSQRIMPILKNFARGGGRKRFRHGFGQGGVAAVIRLDGEALERFIANGGEEKLAALAKRDRVVGVTLLDVDQDATGIQTKEKKLRGGDSSAFASVLVVEALDEPGLRAALASLADDLKGLAVESDRELPLFQLVFALDGRLAA